MKIGLMARCLRPPQTGVAAYTRNLARALSDLVPPSSVTLFVTRDAEMDGLRCDRIAAPSRTPHELMRAAWEQTLVPIEVRRQGIDVYHSPSFTLPLALPCRSVLTVHDLAFLDKRFHNRRLGLYLRAMTQVGLRRVDQVITVSRHTKQQLERWQPHIAGRVTVIYPGLDESMSGPGPAAKAVQAFRKASGIEAPYVLFVGAIEPRKNVPRLVRAFELLIGRTGLPHHLVLCGPWGWRYAPAMRAIASSPLRDRIHHAGFVPPTELRLWYAGADLLAYPSLYEGFGFPPLEAMAHGTPVLTSDSSSLPEVVGEAAVRVSPRSTQAIADGMERVLTDASLADELRQRGRAQAAKFTWRRAAVETLAVYRRAVERG